MEFNSSKFYLLGITCFGLIAFVQGINLIFYYAKYSLSANIIYVIQMIFNIGLALFFHYLYVNDPSRINFDSEEKEIKEILENLKNEK